MRINLWYLAIFFLTLLFVTAGVIGIRSIDARNEEILLAEAAEQFLIFKAANRQNTVKAVRTIRTLHAGLEALIALQPDPERALSDERFLTVLVQDMFGRMALFNEIDQIRLLSTQGLETFRLNLQGGATMVPTELLQDKSDRDYFKAGLSQLESTDIYSAPISLNEEKGLLDPRMLPMQRMGMRVTSPKGSLIGYLFINFIDESKFFPREARPGEQPEEWVVDAEGRFLWGDGSFAGHEFAHQTGTGKSNFADEFPDLWQRMAELPIGFIDTDEGRFVWTSTQAKGAQEFFGRQGLGKPADGAVVQFIPRAFLEQGSILASRVGLSFIALVSALYVGFIFLLARAQSLSRRTARALAREKSAFTELERESMRRARMLATVSHEMRTPVASADMLLTLSSTVTAEEKMQLHDLIKHLLKTMDDLKLVSPIGGTTQKLEALTPTDLINEALVQCRALLAERAFTVKVDVPKFFDRTYDLDRYRVSSAISNLIRNACLHSQGAHIWISASIKGNDSENDELTIRIEDDGTGVSTKDQCVMFEEFSRGDSPSEGMGLGLSIARDWLLEIGGTLVYFDSPHRGAGFEIRLPVVASDTAPSDLSPSPQTTIDAVDEHNLLAGKRILYVEDDPMMRRLGERLIVNTGAEVRSANDGVEALTLMESETFDFVITDYFMPNMNGAELISTLREKGNNIPILATTAATLGGEFEELAQIGATDVCGKPLNATDLVQFAQRSGLA